ncbi:hypothetical protein Asi02nite_74700 [Asanoa siamensis]|uniref:Uncharacterized protein n=1 Tax=Asanoa siamensis TaxID=926357 RepID=A0ABQ4D339_9ACTN|nr:hypothetical protein Asi02nite_74700 [Asanoa siamensis]
MTSSLRVVPLSTTTEVGCRRRLIRPPSGQTRIESIDVYLLLTSMDEDAPTRRSTTRPGTTRCGTAATGGAVAIRDPRPATRDPRSAIGDRRSAIR